MLSSVLQAFASYVKRCLHFEQDAGARDRDVTKIDLDTETMRPGLHLCFEVLIYSVTLID